MLGEYSPDETGVLIIGAILALVLWISWYRALLFVGRRVCARGTRWPLIWAPMLCAALLCLVLRNWAAEDVSRDIAYILFYLVLGAAWLGLFRVTLPWFGISARDDVCERSNDAAAWAIAGALLGGMACFAGGNVGNGPGWWVVVFAALLATMALLVLWWMVHRGSNLAEAITIERDTAAGVRAAGFFIGTGLILGGAVAGDWVSAGATLRDFASAGWPALVLAGAVTGVERGWRPSVGETGTSFYWSGWLPAFIYVGAGLVAMKSVRP
jgi:hypothetical protein